MAYLTNFELSNVSEEIISAFRLENDNAEFALDEEGYASDACKWYNAKEELKEFAKKYPDELFILEGVGEEQGDVWRFYVKGEKSTLIVARLVFDEFDESLLQ